MSSSSLEREIIYKTEIEADDPSTTYVNCMIKVSLTVVLGRKRALITQTTTKVTQPPLNREILRVKEGRQRALIVQDGGAMVFEQSNEELQSKAPPRCNMCRSLEYTARMCVQRHSNEQT